MTKEEILSAVAEERMRQRARWGTYHEWGFGDCSALLGMGVPAEQYSNLIKASVLAEEAGEVVKAALDVDPEAFRTEVIQTLAVAWAILEGIPS